MEVGGGLCVSFAVSGEVCVLVRGCGWLSLCLYLRVCMCISTVCVTVLMFTYPFVCEYLLVWHACVWRGVRADRQRARWGATLTASSFLGPWLAWPHILSGWDRAPGKVITWLGLEESQSCMGAELQVG